MDEEVITDHEERGEVESTSGQHTRIPEAGGLNRHFSWWKENCRNKWVKGWIQDGFPLWWADNNKQPPPFEKKNHAGAFIHASFIVECIRDLLRAKAIKRVHSKPHVVNPLNVTPKKNGKLRLILDLRHVNQFLYIPKFKMDSLKLLSQLATRADSMFAIDLAHGYHQIQMSKEAHDYLGFEWEGQYYVFTALPFGLATAPWCFTKVMLEVVGHLRGQGLRVIAYLDDFLWLVPGSQHVARAMRKLVLSTFQAAGLTINKEKSTLDFVRRLDHLGYVIDLDKEQIEVPEKRWIAFQKLLTFASKASHVKIRLVAQITGHAMSMSLALGPVAKLFTRNSYGITSMFHISQNITMPLCIKQEIDFWLGMSRTRYTAKIWPTVETTHLTIHTDAGGRSWGAVLGSPTDKNAPKGQGYFPEAIRKCSSTLRELLGVWYALQSWRNEIKGRNVQIIVDNQAVEKIVPAGSMKPAIHKIALNIFWLMGELQTRLSVAWVPREENKEADAVTRWFDHDDWQLNKVHFQTAEKKWGPHTMDRFAGHNNHFLPKFNSLFHCPGSSGVDALLQSDWEQHNNWCNPPFALIPNVLGVLKHYQAEATLVVPVWPSRPWWPMLARSANEFHDYVIGCVQLDPSAALFMPGPSAANNQGVGKPRWKVFLLRISFTGAIRGKVQIPRTER
jgi:hypothetical protein